MSVVVPEESKPLTHAQRGAMGGAKKTKTKSAAGIVAGSLLARQRAEKLAPAYALAKQALSEGLSAAAAAERAGVSVSTVSRWRREAPAWMQETKTSIIVKSIYKVKAGVVLEGDLGSAVPLVHPDSDTLEAIEKLEKKIHENPAGVKVTVTASDLKQSIHY